MFSDNWLALYLGLAAIASLASGATLLKRGVRQSPATPWLLLYLVATAAWWILLAARQLGWPVGDGRFWSAPAYGVTLLALLFLSVSHAFLKLPREAGPWLRRLGLLLLLLALLVDINPLGLPDRLPTWPHWFIPRPAVAWFALLLSWGCLALQPLVMVGRAYGQTRRQPLHRNRLSYWLLALLTLNLADGLYFGQWLAASLVARLGAVLLLTYIMTTYQLPDLRRIGRRLVSYLLTILVVAALYSSAFLLAQNLFTDWGADNPLLLGGLLAALVAALFTPLLAGARRLVARLTADTHYNANQILREYSRGISHIVELARLEAVMMRLIVAAMDIQHGTLFLVDHHAGDGEEDYSLRSVQSFGPDRFILGRFEAASPFARYFRQQNRALLQFEVDVLPEFQAAPADEREWLATQGMDVYVPICAHGNWIGLLGLGAKLSGNPYDKNDLILLSTLADQTAVALENARLFEDLVHVNQDLHHAYSALEEANLQLQEMDRLKSAFIGVVTHELRTPFAGIGFSLQLLERHGLDQWPAGQQEELDNLKQGVARARQMVDNLVAFASFISKQGQLRLQPVDLPQLINDAIFPLRPLAQGKDVLLQVEVGPPLSLTADGERLGETLHHLLHNALKFTASGGCVTIGYWSQGDRAYVEVKDTGMGIPADKLEALWDSFSQMADPLRRGAEGLGLGLALVKYVVTAHGGQVWARSEEGSGSTFGFDLPLAGPARDGSNVSE